MDQIQFTYTCRTAAQALQVEASEQDGRCSLSINGIEVLLDLDEEAETVHCYIDLGDPSPHDRNTVCEQLLELNLRTHGLHYGAYAFDVGSARAIFCGSLDSAALVSGEELAEAVRYYLDETDEARQMVASPESYAGQTAARSFGVLFAGSLA
jgi:hypothetical protein